MWERRLFYLLILLLGAVFWAVYQKWLAWLLLLTLLALPLLSLALSILPMRQVKVRLQCPGIGRIGVPSRSSLRTECRLPTPPMRCRIRLVNELTGERYTGMAGELIPTEHCGRIRITPYKPRVYDYLGLFSLRLPVQESCCVPVLPKAVPGELPKYGKAESVGLRPKRGGGVAEEHELRVFRPGDEMRNIHWKMTAKTGKLIYREAMESASSGFVMTVSLYGTPEELDRRLGQLLWSGRELLRRKQAHTVLCATGKGILTFFVDGETALEEMLITLVSAPRATRDILPECGDAGWRHRIGGDGSEA